MSGATTAPGCASRLRRLARPLLMVAALPLLMGSECEEPLVNDSGFDVWCGDTLCNWTVEAGTIAKAPTWNANDLGVSLEGDTTRISQLLTFGDDKATCLHFDLLADVAEPVNVALDVDFDDDDAGHPELTETIPNGAWVPLSYHITAPTYYRGVRITLRKSGAGRAVLAQIQMSKSSADKCSDAPPATSNRPAGAVCEATGECAGGTCLSQVAEELVLPASDTPKVVCEGCSADGASRRLSTIGARAHRGVRGAVRQPDRSGALACHRLRDLATGDRRALTEQS